MLNNIKPNSTAIILSLLCFSLPLFKFLAPLFIILLCVDTLFNLAKKDFFTANNKSLLLLIIFYLLAIISYIFAHNKSIAGFELEVKLSFLILPLCFIFNNQAKKVTIILLLKSFVFGCLVSSLLCLVHSTKIYFNTHLFDSFTYDNISFFHHSSYFAMYLLFALLVSHYLIKITSTTSLFRAVYFFCILIFAVIIILLAAKISLLLLIIYIPYGLYALVLKNNKWFVNALVVLFLLTTTLFIFNKSAVIQLRLWEGFSNAFIPVTSINAKSPDVSSSQMRKLIWKDAITLIIQKPLGYTTGDVDSALVTQYIKTENALATQKHLNAHNQFLQTTLALGIVGLLMLLTLLYYPLFKLNNESWFLYLFFTIIITINFLTESMLQTQSGIVFFVLSYCVLVSNNKKTTTQYKLQ